jgi:acyl dehydratase
VGSTLLYARAALPLVPGASLLPFVAGRGREMPALERMRDVGIDRARLARYADVCGFAPDAATLPATYLHVLAFPLHMELMTDGSFPFPAVGLVHLANRVVVHRPLGCDERYALRATTLPLVPHPKGRTFAIRTEARVDGELVWEGESTMLRRGSGSEGRRSAPAEDAPIDGGQTETWQLRGDLGRRYGAVSGDRNPIHLHPLTARAFGFPRAIAHGMWTKARCLAALQAAGALPTVATVDVTFRKPILLPARVDFAADAGRFVVRGHDTTHLEGTVT